MCLRTCQAPYDLTSSFIQCERRRVRRSYLLLDSHILHCRTSLPVLFDVSVLMFPEFIDDRLRCSRGIRHQQNAYLSLFGYRSSSHFYTWIPLPISFVISVSFFSDNKFMRYLCSFSTPCLTWPSSSTFGTSAPSRQFDHSSFLILFAIDMEVSPSSFFGC
jgi:hypothetical protein